VVPAIRGVSTDPNVVLRGEIGHPRAPAKLNDRAPSIPAVSIQPGVAGKPGEAGPATLPERLRSVSRGLRSVGLFKPLRQGWHRIAAGRDQA
jgi:hypothetical protein